MRNMQKAIEEYKKMFEDAKGRKDAFYSSEMYQIRDISKGDYWSSISNSLMAGFIVGYRYGKRENKTK